MITPALYLCKIQLYDARSVGPSVLLIASVSLGCQQKRDATNLGRCGHMRGASVNCWIAVTDSYCTLVNKEMKCICEFWLKCLMIDLAFYGCNVQDSAMDIEGQRVYYTSLFAVQSMSTILETLEFRDIYMRIELLRSNFCGGSWDVSQTRHGRVPILLEPMGHGNLAEFRSQLQSGFYVSLPNTIQLYFGRR